MCKYIAALTFGLGRTFRWLPSKRNVVDSPSLGGAFPSRPVHDFQQCHAQGSPPEQLAVGEQNRTEKAKAAEGLRLVSLY